MYRWLTTFFADACAAAGRAHGEGTDVEHQRINILLLDKVRTGIVIVHRLPTVVEADQLLIPEFARS